MSDTLTADEWEQLAISYKVQVDKLVEENLTLRKKIQELLQNTKELNDE